MTVSRELKATIQPNPFPQMGDHVVSSTIKVWTSMLIDKYLLDLTLPSVSPMRIADRRKPIR